LADLRPFGFDLGSHLVLHYPAEIDFERLAAWELKPRFALLRAHRGTWPDPAFDQFRAEAERVGLLWGTWHVLSAGELARNQATIWLTRPPGPLGRWVDYEPWRDGSIPTGTALSEAWARLEAADGRPCGCYSRYAVIDTYLNALSAAELNARPWWLAQYLTLQTARGEHPGPPTLPKRVARERIVLHQTADKLAPPAGTVPNAKALDRDRWTGSMSLEQFAQGTVSVLSLAQRVERLEREAGLRGWNLGA
jgi:hypothetical protein